METYCVIIIKTNDQKAAQALTQPDWFVALASADGQEPASHAFINGPIPNEIVDALMNAPFDKWIRTSDWQTALAGLGLQYIQSLG